MNKKTIIVANALMLLSISAFCAEKPKVSFYGFVRNYATYDSRQSKSGTAELYYYVPMDRSINSAGEDMNSLSTFKMSSITSRLGVNASWKNDEVTVKGKIEADFYSGLSGVTGTATLRLRQAYIDIVADDINVRLGQAWHPMAADMPDCLALEIAVPFGPFSRTPQLTFNSYWNDHFYLTFSCLGQMQYTSYGPEGASANYIKYSCVPELYAGLNYKNSGFLFRLGVDNLFIKPRYKAVVDGEQRKVSDKINTSSAFVYLQYQKGLFSAKVKSTFAEAGEHLNMLGGYGVSAKYTAAGEDGHFEYTPTLTSSSWMSISYGRTLKGSLLLGYARNFGTKDNLLEIEQGCSLVDASQNYLAKNTYSNLNSTFRVSPMLSYSFGPLTLGIEYSFSAAEYGEYQSYTSSDGKTYSQCVSLKGLADSGKHWVGNHRVQLLTKFTF